MESRSSKAARSEALVHREEEHARATPGGTGAGSPPANTYSVVRTRAKLVHTERGNGGIGRGTEADAGEGRTSIVNRRNARLAERRKRRTRIILAVVLGLIFPPLLAVYLIAWLIWRGRPKQKSMRRVRQAIRALEKKQTGIALKQLQEAHLLDPSNCDALYWLGLVLVEQHRYDAAIEALTLVSERAPGLSEVEAALLECYYQTGDYEQAIHHGQLLLDVDPYDTMALVKVADSFAALGQVDVAIAVLHHASLYKRTLTEPLKLVHYRLGELYERQDDDVKAQEHFHRVYTSDSSFRDIRAKVLGPQALRGAGGAAENL